MKYLMKYLMYFLWYLRTVRGVRTVKRKKEMVMTKVKRVYKGDYGHYNYMVRGVSRFQPPF